MNKLRFNSKSIPLILKNKHYEEFPNHQCFKDFLLFTIMEYALLEFKNHLKSLKIIAKYCIKELDNLKVKIIFNKLKNHKVINSLIES